MLQNLLKDINTSTYDKKRKHEEIFVNPSKAENAWDITGENVNIDDLLDLANTSENTKKKVKRLETSEKRLNSTLSKPARLRLDRTTQYEDTKEMVGEWQTTVQSMRQAESLQFPLPEQVKKAPNVTTASLTATHKCETELESQIDNILQSSGINEKKLKEIEASQLKEITPEELKARHAHLAKVRSLFFFKEQKNKRIAKIKSKKFRKIHKKKKENEKTSLEELRETDPEAYRDEIKKQEKQRLKERMLLRHKSQTKWAKFALKSEDPNLKRAAQDHLRLGRELVKKIHDEEEEELFEEENQIEDDEEEEEEEDSLDVDNDIVDINGDRISNIDDDDDEFEESVSGRRSFNSKGQVVEARNKELTIKSTNQPSKHSTPVDSVPSTFGVSDDSDVFNLSSAEKTSMEQREFINRAFAADYITEDQLQEEKIEHVQDENDVEKEYKTMTMPGWGEWGGVGTKPSKRRLNLLEEMEMKKAKKERELLRNRKDAKLKHVIINHKKNKRFESNYTLEEVPYPYKEKDLYEKSIRQPLGKEWNTYGSHKALIKPKVVIKGGQVIDPIKKKKK